MGPVLCMVTADRDLDAQTERALVLRVVAAANAGIHLVQIRQPRLEARALTRLVRACVQATKGTTTRVIVNERTDVALAAGAHGVHLRGASLPASRLRPFVPPGFVIGRSVHSADEAARAEADGGLDYLIFGTVFQTPSKVDRAPAGVGALADACRRVALPVLAIGGMSADRAPQVAAAGASGVAGIGLFADGSAETLRDVTTRLARMFDTPPTVT